MQKALAEADPALPFSGFYSMSDLKQQDLGMQRIEVMLLGVLAGLALLLSAIGVYGLIANLWPSANEKSGFAWRSALLSAQRCWRLAGRESWRPTGPWHGLAASLLALRAMKGFIYGIAKSIPRP